MVYTVPGPVFPALGASAGDQAALSKLLGAA